MVKQDFGQNWQYRTEGRDWRKVTLPHDAQLLEARLANAAGGSGHGYFPGGIYQYQKYFFVPKEWGEKHVEILFEGVYRNAEVSLNGVSLAEHRYGYTPFAVSLDEALQYGQENVLCVTADNAKLPNSRWYTGGGIYRPVLLCIGEKGGIPLRGVRITTISVNPAVIRVETDVTGREIQVEILDHGAVIASASGSCAELTLPDARLWSDRQPYLYEARVSLQRNGRVTDSVTEAFGIRSLTWGPEGFFVNGERTLLRGGCVHHDNGILGAASFPESEWRRIRILKEQGFNAVRSAHNPAATAMLEACDYYGMYVMDEAFDMWYLRKTKYDYGMDFRECWRDDVCAMVGRDYNHPSVVMYSIGNEVSEPGKPEGVEQGREIISLIKKLDPSRAVTGGMNLMLMGRYAKGKGLYDKVDRETAVPSGSSEKRKNSEMKDSSGSAAQNGSLLFNTLTSFIGPGMNRAGNSSRVDRVTSPILDLLDIAGYNYASGRYPLEGKKHPGRLVVGSETFPYEIAKNWEMVKKYPYLIGDFMWTAWDYLGEAGLGAWSYTGGMPFNRPYPWLLGGAGVIDILGNPDASCGLAKTVWGVSDAPIIGVRPVNHPGIRVSRSVWRGTDAIESWSWKNCEGNRALIDVFARGSYVELLLNGRSLGKKKLRRCQAFFRTSYAPGILEAISYDVGGRELSRSYLASAEGKTTVCITAEKEKYREGDIAYFDVRIIGENGIVESNDDRQLVVTAEGGELLGFGSANPCTEEQYHTGRFTTYRGRAQAVVRVTDAEKLRLTAVSG